jgi:hypothetical protein
MTRAPPYIQVMPRVHSLDIVGVVEKRLGVFEPASYPLFPEYQKTILVLPVHRKLHYSKSHHCCYRTLFAVAAYQERPAN